MFDKDKAGQIDVREFKIGLSTLTGAGKEEKLKFAFMVFDEDGNGVITKQELIKILKVNHRQAPTKRLCKAETIMAQADKDGDGVVSFDEFVIVSKKFPNILFLAYSLGSNIRADDRQRFLNEFKYINIYMHTHSQRSALKAILYVYIKL